MRRPLGWVLLLLALALPAAARIAVTASGDETRHFPEPGQIVIELNTPPLLDRDGRVSNAAEINILLDRLESDLAEIGARTSVKSAGAGERPRLRHRYSLLFAGGAAKVDPAAIEGIGQLHYVRRVHPDRIFVAHIRDSVAQVGATEVWSRYGARGAGSVVAVIDTGIDYTHPALGGGFGPSHKVRGGRDFVNNDADPMDDQGHGTHVAGIIAANGGGLAGVAPEAALLAYKVLDASGAGRDSWVLAALEEVARQRPHIVNMSLGRPGVADDPVVKAVENAAAQGILFCVSAGNSGRFLDIGSPAAAPSAITVGALDRTGRLASFSTRGPVQPTGAIKPEIAAPGVGIVSATPGGGMRAASGTSMAAPHVAGVAALLRSIHPHWTAARLRAAIIAGGRPMNAEVMAAGAGAVHAADAAGTPWFPSFDALWFGVSDHRQVSWSATRRITFVNDSQEGQSLAVRVDGLQDGIVLQPSVAQVSAEPGGTATVDFDLLVDHTKVRAAESGSLSYGGLIRFESEKVSFSIPWAFVRASRVRVTWNGTREATVRIATAHMFTQAATLPRSPAVDLMVGAGPATMWVESGAGLASEAHHVFLENLDFTARDVYTIGPDDAPFRLSFRGRDASGRLLSDGGRNSVRQIAVNHPHFAARPLDAISDVPASQAVFVSSTSDEVRLLISQRAFDQEPRTTWIAVYPPVTHIDGDVDLTLSPTGWRNLPSRAVVPVDLVQPYHVVWANVWLTIGRQTVSSIIRPNWPHGEVPVTETSTWIIPSSSAETGATVMIEFGERGGAPPGLPQALSPDFFAEFSAGQTGFLPGRRQEPRGSDQPHPSGVPIVIGEGPPRPLSFAAAGPGTATAAVQWFGPHGEQRFYDNKRMEGRLYSEGGTLIATGVAPPRFLPIPGFLFNPGFQLFAAIPQPGSYRFEAVNRSFEVAGIRGKATLTLTFDSRLDDATPPVLTSLRITDGSRRTTAALSTGSAAALVFSAVDTGAGGVRDLRREKTTVEYRAHSQPDWIPIAAVSTGEDFGPSSELGRPPDGVVYHAGLSAATTLSGPVDLRIAVEDQRGNRTVYLLEPAFVVGGAKQRAANR